MSQEYTPVTWVDETPNTPGTVINKARLDQMQTAHHFADGFEEVDAVPTTDPGVDYHKVVYCTADTTFYRWDGSAWTKDVDDETKALLLAHEADHDNPHVVTKAQVGLGNVDNTSDLDKPISTATQTALDAKLDANASITGATKCKITYDGKGLVTSGADLAESDIPALTISKITGLQTALDGKADDATTLAGYGITDAYDKSQVDTLLATKQDTLTFDTAPTASSTNPVTSGGVYTALTNGTVTKIGTSTVGGNLKPIYLNAGVPTAVANDLVDVASAQTVTGLKTFSHSSGEQVVILKDTRYTLGAAVTAEYINRIYFQDSGSGRTATFGKRVGPKASGRIATYLGMTNFYDSSHYGFFALRADWVEASNTYENYMTGPSRTYSASNTSDVATIGTLDAYTPMVRTTGNQTITGEKTFTTNKGIKTELSSGQFGLTGYQKGLDIVNKTLNGTALSSRYAGTFLTAWRDANDVFMADYQVLANTDGSTDVQLRTRNADGTIKYTIMNDAVLTNTAQTISGAKTFSSTPIISSSLPTINFKSSVLTRGTTPSANTNSLLISSKGSDDVDIGTLNFRKYTDGRTRFYTSIFNSSGTESSYALNIDNSNAKWMTAPSRTYSASNTDDVATIGTLDAYTPMVRTSGNQQAISGIKGFISLNSSRVKNTSGSTKYFIYAKLPSDTIMSSLKIGLILTSREVDECGYYMLYVFNNTMYLKTTATTPASFKIVTDGTSNFLATQMSNNNIKSVMILTCFDTNVRTLPEILSPYAVTTETDVVT